MLNDHALQTLTDKNKPSGKITLTYGEAASLFKLASPLLKPVCLSGNAPSLTSIFSECAYELPAVPNQTTEHYLEQTLDLLAIVISVTQAAAYTLHPDENEEEAIALLLSNKEYVSTFGGLEEITSSFLKTKKAFEALKEANGGATYFNVNAASIKNSITSFIRHPLRTIERITDGKAFKDYGINAFMD